jgi:hypothetical protein
VVQPVNLDDWLECLNASEDDLKRAWGEQVSTAGWLAEMLLKMRWAVVFSEEQVFITSDNPVMIVHPSLKFRGLKKSGDDRHPLVQRSGTQMPSPP